MINNWFFIGLVLAFALRFVGGQVISITAGMAAGVILFDLVKFIIWLFKKGVD